MLDTKMAKALNDQINREMYSAYLYMSMSSYSKKMGLNGFSNWFMVQYHEEMYHAMKLYHYLQRHGVHVKLEAIKEPPAEFTDQPSMFTATLQHEKYITDSINNLVELAVSLKDHTTRAFLEWYLTEQVEEMVNDNYIIGQLKMVGDNTQALLMLDRELAARAVTIPIDFSKVLI